MGLKLCYCRSGSNCKGCGRGLVGKVFAAASELEVEPVSIVSGLKDHVVNSCLALTGYRREFFVATG